MDTGKQEILGKWLKSGYVEEGKLYPTHKGTPQGGIISPTIANMTLDGLEKIARAAVPARMYGNIRSKVNVIRYADDFIITGATREILQKKVKPAVQTFLSERGLTLSEEKTRITRIEKGFDFLGRNCRKYGGKLLIKPSKSNVRAFLDNITQTIRNGGAMTAVALIGALNPKIRGWANYHRHIVAGKVFGKVDNCIYEHLWRWMRRRHPRKRKSWLVSKYWSGGDPWRFSAVEKKKDGKVRKYELIRAHSIGIERHVKIRGDANPFDLKYQAYFSKRCQKRKKKRSGNMAYGIITWEVQPGPPARTGL
jgi:RNA-directed DNA polymerase